MSQLDDMAPMSDTADLAVAVMCRLEAEERVVKRRLDQQDAKIDDLTRELVELAIMTRTTCNALAAIADRIATAHQ